MANAGSADGRPPLVRVKLQTQPPLPSLRCWFEVLPSDASVAGLARRIADALAPAVPHASADNISLELEGFALLPLSPVSLVRDGDLLVVSTAANSIFCQPYAAAAPILPSDAVSVLGKRNASNDDISIDNSILPETPRPPSRPLLGAASTPALASSPALRVSALINVASTPFLPNVTSTPTANQSKPTTFESTPKAAPTLESVKNKSSQLAPTESSIVSEQNTSITVQDASAVHSENADQPRSRRSKKRRKSKTPADSLVEQPQETTSTQPAQPQSEPEPAAPNSTSQISKPPAPQEKQPTPSKPQQTPQPLAAPPKSISDASADSASVRIPSNLTKTKLKVVRSMLNTERSHVRFEEEGESDLQDDATPDEHAAKDFLQYEIQTVEMEESPEEVPPEIVYTEVLLKDLDAVRLARQASKNRSANPNNQRKNDSGSNENDKSNAKCVRSQQQSSSKQIADKKQSVHVPQPLQQQSSSNGHDSTASHQPESTSKNKKKQEQDSSDSESDKENDDSDSESEDGEIDDDQINVVSKRKIDYDALPYLQGMPQPDMLIAFKMLEMSPSFTPEMSAYKEAIVLKTDYVNKTVSLKLAPHCVNPSENGSNQSDSWGHMSNYRRLHGKFDISYHADDDENDDASQDDFDDEMTVDLAALLEVKIVSN